MADDAKFHRPILVAVWPGMGHVAINAGVYLLAKLSMNLFAEFTEKDQFDIESIDVKDGLVKPAVLPRNRLFAWKDPAGKQDIIVFLGEAQPPTGKYAFCQKLIELAKEWNVERVFTFAAMATQMRPENKSRVFGVATDPKTLEELKRLELDILEDGQISGLNGLLLSVAVEAGLPGACLLGEIPHVFAQFPFPKASLGVLEVFTTMTSVPLDVAELAEQSRTVEARLVELLSQAERAMAGQQEDETDSFPSEAVEEESGLSQDDKKRIEDLFQQSKSDRSRAYELKRELDRLNVFKEYEDRFLDLFKNAR